VTARAEVHRGLDPARRDAAQARDDVVVDDDQAERRVAATMVQKPARGDRPHAREQREAGEDAGQRDRQHEQQRDRLLAAERATGERECRSVPRMIARSVAAEATSSESRIDPDVVAAKATSNQCSVNPGGGNWYVRSSVVNAYSAITRRARAGTPAAAAITR